MSNRIIVKMPDGTRINAPKGVTRADIEARYGRYLRKQKLIASNPGEYDPTSKEWQDKYGPTAGMGTGEKVFANIGAGMTNLGLGVKQLFTFDEEKEKEIERQIAEKRELDDKLAGSVRGGRVLQIAGEIAPTFAIPAGTIARGITALPKIGAAARAAGVGTRALPTITAEGGVTGAALGSIVPTGENDNPYSQALIGGVGGAAVPAAGAGLGALARKYFPQSILGIKTGTGKLAERAMARSVATDLGANAPRAERQLAAYQKRVQRGIDEPPMSTAMVTQNPKLAERELAARASKGTSEDWAQFDEVIDNARWDILDRNLANAKSVEAAMEATEKFADKTVPKFLTKVKPAKFREAVDDFKTALQMKLQTASVIANPAARKVYGFVAATGRALNKAGHEWSPMTLWDVRKSLSGWLSGRPPPGLEAVRAPKLDRFIMDARNAIDSTINRASGNQWSKFLTEFGEFLSVEGSKKAGQNIRNAFMDETLGIAGKPVTQAGSPKVTEHALRQAFTTHGQTKFGPRLDSTQEDAVRAVLENLQAQGVLQRAKATMTGRGGSQTAPLSQRIGESKTGGDIAEFARLMARGNSAREQKLMSQAMVSPELALKLLKSGRVQFSPLTRRQLQAIAGGTRAALPLERGVLEEFFTADRAE